VRVADGADLDKVLGEESTKRQRLRWLAYAVAGVGAVAVLFVGYRVIRTMFKRLTQIADKSPIGPTP
jgi:hypothetical protein